MVRREFPITPANEHVPAETAELRFATSNTPPRTAAVIGHPGRYPGPDGLGSEVKRDWDITEPERAVVDLIPIIIFCVSNHRADTPRVIQLKRVAARRIVADHRVGVGPTGVSHDQVVTGVGARSKDDDLTRVPCRGNVVGVDVRVVGRLPRDGLQRPGRIPSVQGVVRVAARIPAVT